MPAWSHACMRSDSPARSMDLRLSRTGRQAGGEADAKEPLQVRIPSSVKRRFKAAAAMRGIEPNELFVEVWQHYERTGPDATKKARR